MDEAAPFSGAPGLQRADRVKQTKDDTTLISQLMVRTSTKVPKPNRPRVKRNSKPRV